MWYYRFVPTFLNLPKVFFYIFFSIIQMNSAKTYKKVKFIDNNSSHSNHYFLKDTEICSNESNNCNCLLLLSKFDLLTLFKNIRYLFRIRIYDINYFGHFGMSMIIKIHFYDLTDIKLRTRLINQSFNNLNKLKNQISKNELYILGNNSEYSNKKKKIEGDFVMICNDALNDTELISKKIIILSIADPLFFFSETEYSVDYLKKLKKFEKFIDYLVIPTSTISIINKLGIKSKIIAVNSTRYQKNIYEIKDKQFYSRKTHNIFTQYMLPIAFFLNVNTYIGGITYSLKNIDSLWSYDKSVVKGSKKSFAFKYSFFKDRNFKKYYKSHYYYLNKFINENNKIYKL